MSPRHQQRLANTARRQSTLEKPPVWFRSDRLRIVLLAATSTAGGHAPRSIEMQSTSPLPDRPLAVTTAAGAFERGEERGVAGAGRHRFRATTLCLWL
jgi:hypothetical protein